MAEAKKWACELASVRATSQDTEEEAIRLWNQFRRGNGNALGKLISIFYRDMYAYGSRFTSDSELLKDCIQEICLTLWKNRKSLAKTSHVKFYLLKSLRRKLLKELQKEKPESLDDMEFHAGYEPELPHESHLIRDEQLQSLAIRMRRILSQLSKRQQEVIYLRFYMELNMDEIACMMSVNKQSVYNHLHDALKRLKSLAVPLHIVVSLLIRSDSFSKNFSENQ